MSDYFDKEKPLFIITLNIHQMSRSQTSDYVRQVTSYFATDNANVRVFPVNDGLTPSSVNCIWSGLNMMDSYCITELNQYLSSIDKTFTDSIIECLNLDDNQREKLILLLRARKLQKLMDE